VSDVTGGNQKSKSIDDKWNDLWNAGISKFVVESVDVEREGAAPLDSPGVTLEEIRKKTYLFHPYVRDLIRPTRELFSKISLDAMVEDRGFNEYRNGIEEVLLTIVAQAKSVRAQIVKSNEMLKSLEEQLKSQPSSGSQDNEIDFQMVRRCMNDADAQANSIGVLFGDKTFQSALYYRLRMVHAEVESKWSSWQKRANGPLLNAILFGVLFYTFSLLVNVLTGFGSLSLFAFVVAISAFMFRYNESRAKLVDSINEVRSSLAYLYSLPGTKLVGEGPKTIPVVKKAFLFLFALIIAIGFFFLLTWFRMESLQAFLLSYIGGVALQHLLQRNWSKPGHKEKAVRNPPFFELPTESIWRATVTSGEPVDKALKVVDAINSHVIYGRANQNGDGVTDYALLTTYDGNVKVWRSIAFGVIVLTGLILVVVAKWIYSDGTMPPIATVLGQVKGNSCSIAHGILIRNWSGRAGVWVKDRGYVSSGDDDSRSLIVGDEPVWPDCSELKNSQLTDRITHVSFNTNLVRANILARHVVAFPSPQKPISVNDLPNAAGIAIPDDRWDGLEKFADGLKACEKLGKKAAIDVWGYSSTIPFVGLSEQESQALNLGIAEQRRSNVIQFLLSGTKNPMPYSSFHVDWEKQPFRLEPPTKTKWSSYKHMTDVSRVRDDGIGASRELVQRVEIDILDAGGCTNLGSY
jgi:hypothetical protein